MKNNTHQFVSWTAALCVAVSVLTMPRAAIGEQMDLAQALVSYRWSWVKKSNQPGAIQFFKDGTWNHLEHPIPGEHWKVDTQRTVLLEDEKGATVLLTFNASYTSFTGTAFGGRPVHGERGAAIAAADTEKKAKSDEPPPAAAPQTHPPSSPSAGSEAPPSSKIDELRQHASSMSESVLAPLEVTAGADFRGYIDDLKEDIMDEGARKPAANGTAYSLAVRFCNTLVAVENERDALVARLNNNLPTGAAGNPVTTKGHPNWIDLAREQDEAARATHNNTIETPFHKQLKVQWGLRATDLRKTLEAEIAQFRAALRQSPPPR